MWLMVTGTGDARIKVPDQITPGDVIVVNSIISHPMDTGFFRRADGSSIPAYFIKDVVVTYGGQQIARFEWTSGISRDPVISFTLKADKEAPLAMVWTDNQGGVFTQTVDIAFAAA
jgi:sulfur-oxidizing protein SoxZ